MGLLDDAIREHLDLKRRRGADPAEIERAEREALGPVRRNREPGLADDSEPVAEAELDPALGSALDEPDDGIASDLVEESYDEDDLFVGPRAEAGAGDAFAGGEDVFEDEDVEGDEESEEDESPFAEEPESPFAQRDDPFAGDDPLAEEDDPHRTQVMRTADIPAPGDATAEYDVQETFTEDAEVPEPRPAAAGEDGEEDVLEETPEFLQDTPDHDRLWFEQRPPRDFDFDG